MQVEIASKQENIELLLDLANMHDDEVEELALKTIANLAVNGKAPHHSIRISFHPSRFVLFC